MNKGRGLWRGRGFLSHLVPGPSMSGAGWVVAQTGSESGQWSREERLDRFAWERPTGELLAVCPGTCWPLVVLGFSVGMEAFDELMSINVPWSQVFPGVMLWT